MDGSASRTTADSKQKSHEKSKKAKNQRTSKGSDLVMPMGNLVLLRDHLEGCNKITQAPAAPMKKSLSLAEYRTRELHKKIAEEWKQECEEAEHLQEAKHLQEEAECQQKELEYWQAEVKRIRKEQELLCREQENLQAEQDVYVKLMEQQDRQASTVSGSHTPVQDEYGEDLDYFDDV